MVADGFPLVVASAKHTFVTKDVAALLSGCPAASAPPKPNHEVTRSPCGELVVVGNRVTRLPDLMRERKFGLTSAGALLRCSSAGAMPPFAREVCLLPLHRWAASGADPGTCDSDAVHAAACTKAHECPRCRFEAGFVGRLRKGRAGFLSPRPDVEWQSMFAFQNLAMNKKDTWIAGRPAEWGVA